jgi:hypothetical protein
MNDPNLIERNKAIMWVLVALVVMLYGVAFIRVGGGH